MVLILASIFFLCLTVLESSFRIVRIVSSVIRGCLIAAPSSCCSVQQVAGELVVLLPVNGGFAGVTVEAAGVADQCAAPSAPNLHRPMLSGNTKLSCLSSPLSWPSQTDAASCVCRPSIGIGELNSCSNPPVSKLAISRLNLKAEHV